jgi:hypothetical protein
MEPSYSTAPPARPPLPGPVAGFPSLYASTRSKCL